MFQIAVYPEDNMRGWLLSLPAKGRGFLLFIVATIAVETLFRSPLRGFPQPTTIGLPISVRFVGKIFLTPRGDKGRHQDLLPLRLAPDRVVYLQVDDFHTASKTQGELSLLYDMRRRRSHVRVANGEKLAAFLDAYPEVLRGEKIAMNGYFYRASGLLMIAETHLIVDGQ
jgi:hypothetical protein